MTSRCSLFGFAVVGSGDGRAGDGRGGDGRGGDGRGGDGRGGDGRGGHGRGDDGSGRSEVHDRQATCNWEKSTKTWEA